MRLSLLCVAWFVHFTTVFGQRRYITRPEFLPPKFDIVMQDYSRGQLADGYYWIAVKPFREEYDQVQRSIGIYDNNFDLVYYDIPSHLDGSKGAFNWRPQVLNGEVVATYFYGELDSYEPRQNFFRGSNLIIKPDYSIISNTTVKTISSDPHEGTILATAREIRPKVDFSGLVLGNKEGTIVENCFEELELNGTLAKRICPADVGIDITKSMQKDSMGNYLISSRHLSAVFYISGKDNSVLWQLGGIGSDFYGNGTRFQWQHNAMFAFEKNKTVEEIASAKKRYITLFNNDRAWNTVHRNPHHFVGSHGMLIELDMETMTALVKTTYFSKKELGIISDAEGSMQMMSEDSPALATGNCLVSYGNQNYFTEFNRAGDPLMTVKFGTDGITSSYRVFKGSWIGFPTTAPDIVMRSNKIYISWNGATEVKNWRVYADGQSLATFAKTGFETSLDLGTPLGQVLQVAALDAQGRELARSQNISPNGTLIGGELRGNGCPVKRGSKCVGERLTSNLLDTNLNKMTVGTGSTSTRAILFTNGVIVTFSIITLLVVIIVLRRHRRRKSKVAAYLPLAVDFPPSPPKFA